MKTTSLRTAFLVLTLLALASVLCSCKTPSTAATAATPGGLAVSETAAPSPGLSVKTPPLPDGLKAFDFGNAFAWWDFAQVPGSKNVSLSRGVSFASGSKDKDFPDPLLSDYVFADEMTLTVSGLEKGLYRAAVIAQNVGEGMVPAKDFEIFANDLSVVKVTVTPEWYFSRNGFFYGVQFDDLPSTGYWDRYVEPVAPWRQFTFQSDGRLVLKLANCRLYALVIAPQSSVSDRDFTAFIEATQAARKAYFLFNKFRFTADPPRGRMRLTQEDENRGYVLFHKHWDDEVTYNTLPRLVDTRARFEAAGAPGQRLPLTMSVRTLKPLTGVSVSVSDLVSPDGSAIPASAVSVDALRYMMMHDSETSYRISPEAIEKQSSITLPADITKTWWLTINIPADARPGYYTGQIQFKHTGAPPSLVAFTLEVYPFTLVPPACSIGVWYEDPRDQGYLTGLLGGLTPAPPAGEGSSAPSELDKSVEAYRLAMLEADLKSLSEHGFNSITVPVPRVVSVSRDGQVVLDFSALDAYRDLLPKYSINTDFSGQTYLLGVARQIVTVGADGRPVEEYSELHKKAYKNAVTQVFDYWQKAGIKLLAYVVDEPREKDINPWNRNLDGTLYYLRLIREIGSLKSTVTTMRDVQNNVSYKPILEAEDLIQPHPSPHNGDSVQYAARSGKPLRFFNGAGFRRLDFGFYIYSRKPEGYWQWHFDFRSFSYNPFWESSVGYVTFPSADGPISTPRYERAAQGIYDYRYALTLEDYIKKAKASGAPAALEAAKHASALLDTIKKTTPQWVLDRDWKAVDVPSEQLESYRRRIAVAIKEIQSALK